MFVVSCHYVYSDAVTSTRTRALDAAIDLVGTEGLRALTHARVDERAGLPKGSTSNHFRTRSALLSGVVEWMAEREISELSPPSYPESAPDLVDMLCGFIEYTTGPNRILTTARLVLFLEASHDSALREAVSRGRALMKAWAVPVLARLGTHDPQAAADAVMACCEGLVLHRIARGDDTDPRPALDLVVKAALR
jgi:AcrR family transcriptional regulator